MEVASPKVSETSGPSVIWIIPVITLLVGVWLIFKTLSEQGPQATISFKTADSIEVGKTKVKYKNVDIGVVEEVHFSDDFSHVVLSVQFDQGTELFLKRNTRFWVVKPQLSMRGATGLGTLISGAYVEIEPGPGAKQNHFVGLERQPVVTADDQGEKITLITERLRSIDTGSPLYYKGLEAGEVLGYELANDRNSIYIYAFIKSPFHQLVRGNTRFWNVSGVDVSVGADGVQVQTESIRSIVYGGVAFETPETLEQATTQLDDLVFTLYDNYASISEVEYSKKIKFILFFNSSVRGLSRGAPVEFKGIKVGSVLDVRLEFDAQETSFRIPVLIEIEPQRIISRGGEAETSYATLQKLVERGLRARLQTGSLITSQLYVDLDMHPGTAIVLSNDGLSNDGLSNDELPFPELPTLDTTDFAAITQSAEALLAKFNAVDVDGLATALLNTINSANNLMSTPELETAMKDLPESMQSLKNILQKLDSSNIDQVVVTSQQVLEQLESTLDKTVKLLEPNSPMQYNLIKLTDELEEMARSVRMLLDTLERNPQSLLFGKESFGKDEKQE